MNTYAVSLILELTAYFLVSLRAVSSIFKFTAKNLLAVFLIGLLWYDVSIAIRLSEGNSQM